MSRLYLERDGGDYYIVENVDHQRVADLPTRTLASAKLMLKALEAGKPPKGYTERQVKRAGYGEPGLFLLHPAGYEIVIWMPSRTGFGTQTLEGET